MMPKPVYRVSDHWGPRRWADKPPDVNGLVRELAAEAAGDGEIVLDRPVALDGLRIEHPVRLRTAGGGWLTMPDEPRHTFGLRLDADDCRVALRVRSPAGPAGRGRRSGVMLVNNGRRNRVSLKGFGMRPTGYALVSEGSRAEDACYPRLDLRDCPGRSKGFRITGPRGGVKRRVTFGRVDAASAVFLVDPEPGRVEHVRVDHLRLTGRQEWDGKGGRNGAKFAYCDLVEIGRADCLMPAAASRHFCITTQQEVGELWIGTLRTSHPLRVLDAVAAQGAGYNLKRLVVERLIAPTLDPVGGARPWLVGADRVGEVWVGGGVLRGGVSGPGTV